VRRTLNRSEISSRIVEQQKLWADVLADAKDLGDKVNRVKKRLNRDAAAKMTDVRLAQSDSMGEIAGWLTRIHAMLS
jgi:putative ATP-dependent endonuclease of the OLD family